MAQLKGLKGIQKRKKPKKKVELSPAQQAEMEERMKKLREARQKKRGDKKPANVHPSVLEKPVTDMLSYDNVKEWIKYNKDILNSYRPLIRQKVPGAMMKHEMIRGYISDMEHYIRSGDWISNYTGREMQNRTRWRAIAAAESEKEDFFTGNKRLVDNKVVELEEYLEMKQEGLI